MQSRVFVHVNKLDSTETIVPYEYTRYEEYGHYPPQFNPRRNMAGFHM